MATARVSRGRASQQYVADFLQTAFPGCRSRAASLPGADVYPTEGYVIEVKARRDFKPTEWSRQASKYAGEEFPVAIMRPDGYGEARVGQWLAFMTLKDWRDMVVYIQRLETRVGELSDQPHP